MTGEPVNFDLFNQDIVFLLRKDPQLSTLISFFQENLLRFTDQHDRCSYLTIFLEIKIMPQGPQSLRKGWRPKDAIFFPKMATLLLASSQILCYTSSEQALVDKALVPMDSL